MKSGISLLQQTKGQKDLKRNAKKDKKGAKTRVKFEEYLQIEEEIKKGMEKG
jgi:hypothetical protein